ncbi:MAG TPA: DUF4129 domain-containing protein [Gemmatimonadaceae bacterium]|nr:DUF4129 domain-containing protein [Gemmatimonadaceae bacterium]
MQHRLPVSETAIRDTMAAVFRQAAFARRQPSWIARKITEFFEWLWDLLRQLGGTRTSSPAVFWTVMTIVIVVAVAIIARLAWVSYLRRNQGIAAREAPGGGAGSAQGDPWTAAQQHAARGDFTAAAHSLYLALLTAIARRGLIRLHPSKTVGDYVRELRARSATVFTRFRDFARAYETVVYGTGVCDQERYEKLQRLALPIVQSDG